MELSLQEENTQVEKKNFDFVDTIRCISMIGIVFEHSAAVPTNIYHNFYETFVETSVIQFFKFSTIAFFLIGGFLINHKFQEYTPGQYLKNRFKSTVRPWLFWICVFILFTLIDQYVIYFKGDHKLVNHFSEYFGALIIRVLFFTSYWFILNFLFCISILLIFKKHLYNIWFGVFWGCVSLLYSANLYFNWTVTTHSTALLGFVFYLWLGVYMNKFFDQIMEFLRNTSWAKMIFVALGLFLLSDLESFYLIKLGSHDAYNTLRVSNILYSLGMFGILLKMGGVPSIQKRFQPRDTTFGIHLIHFLLIDRFLPLIFQPLRLNFLHYSVWTNSAIHILRFLVIYTVSFFIAKLITTSRAKWIVGR